MAPRSDVANQGSTSQRLAINFGYNINYPIGERSEQMAFPSQRALVMYAWLACVHGRWDSHPARSCTQWHTPHGKPGLSNPVANRKCSLTGYTSIQPRPLLSWTQVHVSKQWHSASRTRMSARSVHVDLVIDFGGKPDGCAPRLAKIDCCNARQRESDAEARWCNAFILLAARALQSVCCGLRISPYRNSQKPQ